MAIVPITNSKATTVTAAVTRRGGGGSLPKKKTITTRGGQNESHQRQSNNNKWFNVIRRRRLSSSSSSYFRKKERGSSLYLMFIALLFLLLLLSLTSWWNMMMMIMTVSFPEPSSFSSSSSSSLVLLQQLRGRFAPSSSSSSSHQSHQQQNYNKKKKKKEECVLPPQPMTPQEVQVQLDSFDSSSSSPPTGIVTTLILFSSNGEEKNNSTTTNDGNSNSKNSWTIGDQQLVSSICNLFPSQLTHFIIPQQLDVLFVIAGGGIVNHQNYVSILQKCLNLQQSHEHEHHDHKNKNKKHRNQTIHHDDHDHDEEYEKEWNNLDGTTTMITSKYYITTVLKGIPFRTTIYLVTQPIELPYPKTYIQHQEEFIEPPMCRAPLTYIHGTRWYTNELLQLSILQKYDYFIKLDPDIVFLKSLPFHILHDMKVRGGIIGHTGSYPMKLTPPCSNGIQQALVAYSRMRRRMMMMQQQQQERTGSNVTKVALKQRNSKSMKNKKNGDEKDEDEDIDDDDDDDLLVLQNTFCTNNMNFQTLVQQQFSDRYYTNLFIGKVDFFTHPMIRSLGNFLSNEYQPNGFYTYRWTDQMFWHIAYHLLVFHREQEDQDEDNTIIHQNTTTTTSAIVDYTEFRCAPSSTCWMSSLEGKHHQQQQQSICANNGAFLHTKNAQHWSSRWNRHLVTLPQNIPKYTIPYATKYREDCST